MQVTAVISQKGRLVVCAWAAIPCAVLTPFFFWRGAGYGIALLLFAALLLFTVYARAVSFVAAAHGQILELHNGIVFPTARRVPRGAVCGTGRYSSPLLNLAGCRLLVLYTPGGTIFLAGISIADADALCAWILSAGNEAQPT